MVKPVFFQSVSMTTDHLEYWLLPSQLGGEMASPVTSANQRIRSLSGPLLARIRRKTMAPATMVVTTGMK